MNTPLSVVILAAGRGTRMKTEAPKVLFDLCGLPSLVHVVRTARTLEPERIVVVVSKEGRVACEQAVAADAACGGVSFVVQDPPLGTGHAVRTALAAVDADRTDLLVLYGDGPLIRAASLRLLHERHRQAEAGASLLTAVVEDPTGLGRIITEADGRVVRIVEELDADDAEKRIRLVNTGILLLGRGVGRAALEALTSENAKGEFYLTDTSELIRQAGRGVESVPLEDPTEASAFNSTAELATVRALLRARIVKSHQEHGVDFVDPATSYVDVDVEIGPGTRVLPCTVIGKGVRIGPNCLVGPFAHLRVETVLEEGVQIGNFTEIKKSVIGAGTKALHLSYLGDARVGEGANIGCGTITANYDGKRKHATTIGKGAFIGSGTILIAPAEVGENGVTGAGAVVLRDTHIGAGEVYIGMPARPLKRKDKS
ncbi:MAG: NTP transferase domain-containing protein [Planctomycetota bacterium]